MSTGGGGGTGGAHDSAGAGGALDAADAGAAHDTAGTGGKSSGVGGGECTALVTYHCKGWFEVYCEGRRHVTWRRRSRSGGVLAEQSVGAWYARAAANEAGSVHSFRMLVRELQRTTLRARFARRLRSAARDEIRHARLIRAEARRHGAALVENEFSKGTERSLLEVAVENARAGCVEETWAALVAHVQAARASSTRARRLFAEIAANETRHAGGHRRDRSRASGRRAPGRAAASPGGRASGANAPGLRLASGLAAGATEHT